MAAIAAVALPIISYTARKLKTHRTSRVEIPLLLSLILIAILAAVYWFARSSPANPPALSTSQVITSTAERKILYYRDPSGAPYWSAVPKKDSANRDYTPVYDDAEPSLELKKEKSQPLANGSRRILFYRNPMGLPDTSPVPKKDSMGMDYIAVYEGEDQDASTTVKISLDKIQRSGVRTEAIEKRIIMQPIRAVGTVKIDERRVTVVAMRSEGYIEELFVNTTGQSVRLGEPLFRVYSSQIQQAQIDLMTAMKGPRLPGMSLDGPMQRLRNLGIPESRIQEVQNTSTNPRTLDWPSPATGTVIEKRIVNGQRVLPGDELFRIADLSNVWVIADVAESDLGSIGLGMQASVTVRAYPQQPIEGKVTFIYPELRPETRTARVRIETPNPDGRLRADMYADVIIRAGMDERTVVAIPDSALIDSGTRQVVLISKGEGRFEPRPVKLGRRGSGYFEVIEGVAEGEKVVTSATFLIDSESNLKAALKAFTQPEPAK